MSDKEKAERIIKEITEAFKGVELGDGIGLWQAQALDDYEPIELQKKAREKDEKIDWANIPIEQLNRCYSSPSFFDAEGMRFHLPAFMICDLKNEYNFDFCFSLTQINDYQMTQFSNLNKKQRQAVRHYLRYVMEIDAFSREDIEKDLKRYWSEENDPEH